jgi:hypothetical protein
MFKSGPKGKDYERHIAKILSDWCGFPLIRTPMSGAWQGTAGDIIPKNKTDDFPFLVECKKQEHWQMEQLLSNTGPFADWVQQAVEGMAKDAEHGRDVRTFMLIFSRNRKPDYIACTHSLIPDDWPEAEFVAVRPGLLVFELYTFLNLYNFNQLRHG